MTKRSKWKKAGEPEENDFFPKVPWWLRVARFLKPKKGTK